MLRSELRRLFRWLKDKSSLPWSHGERTGGGLTRHGLEEYISDCVILLDHRVTETVFTRRLRVVKYRGSTHGTSEYPFLIDQEGIRTVNKQRYEMEDLDAISHLDPSTMETVGWKDVRDDEFWVRGHIPGRPILPGVIQLEALAQPLPWLDARTDDALPDAGAARSWSTRFSAATSWS